MSLAGLIVKDPPNRQAQSCGAARRNEEELEDRVCITGVLSCPALSPDSTPDCHPGRGKATVLTGQRRHCNPSSHRPAFISFGLSQPAILTAWPDLCGRGEYPVLVAPGVVTLPQSHLTSAIQTELGCGVSQGTTGSAALPGHQQVGVDISCKKDFCLRGGSSLGGRADQDTRRMICMTDCHGETPPVERKFLRLNFRNLIIETRIENNTNVIKLIRRSFWHSSEISPILTAISLTRS